MRRVLALGWCSVLLLVTLTPTTPYPDGTDVLCLLCGTRGTADAMLNVLLFLPAGLLLPRRRRTIAWAAILGIVASASIETAQIFVPGRYPTLGDIVWNGIGASLGIVGWHTVRARARNHGGLSGRAGPLSAVVIGGLVIIAGWLLQSRPTHGGYWLQWTPVRGGMAHYGGELLAVRLNGRTIRRGEIPADRELGEQLLGDWRLDVRVVKGPEPPTLAPVLILGDDELREVLMLGVDGELLVWRERTRAAAVRLDQPDHRLAGALADHRTGDTISISVDRKGHERCVGVETTVTCELLWTPGRTHSLLLSFAQTDRDVHALLDALWMAALFFVVGFLSRSPTAAAKSGAVLGLTVLLAVATTRLGPPPVEEIVAAVLGLALGFGGALVWSGWIRRRSSPSRPGSPGSAGS